MAHAIEPELPMTDRELLELVLGRVDEMLERFGAVEELLERYGPLLELAEKKMAGPKLFGRGAPRVDNKDR